MPVYVYECPDCLRVSEVHQSINSDWRPSCMSSAHDGMKDDERPIMIRLIQPVGFSLKGGCWAKDGYSK